ncbi:DUF1566 domain-containing protein [Pseudomonas batumici]|uniref:DUF1566 domain-containing protein n=1 Tax=Pseudomonas batumici TaxID=226910 RepID=UPI0030CD1D9E
MSAQQKLTPPAIGEIWPGKGGIYGGLRQYPEGLCHIIFAVEDVPGRHTYGDYGVNVDAESRTDGRANTLALLAAMLKEQQSANRFIHDLLSQIPDDQRSKHPAAIAAASYTADGHTDFYLPSIGELHHGWQFAPESFSSDWYYISSTQRSASYAFSLLFVAGLQLIHDKYHELRVRPVRRFLQ